MYRRLIISLGVGGKRGLVKGKRGSSAIEAALHIPPYGMLEKKSVSTITMAIHKETLSADHTLRETLSQPNTYINYGSLGG